MRPELRSALERSWARNKAGYRRLAAGSVWRRPAAIIRAIREGRSLAGIVQGTMSLEGQGLGQEAIWEVERRIIRRLLRDSRLPDGPPAPISLPVINSNIDAHGARGDS